MIRVFFGSPGCGKTTQAVKHMRRTRRRLCFGNFNHSVPNARVCDLSDLGEWTFPYGSYIMVDEAGIEYNSRAYKTLPKHTIAWFKLHRHHGADIDVFSQSWEDMDITLRRLTDELWYMYRLGPFTLCRRVFKRVTVDQNTEQIIDGYKMASGLWLLFWPLQLGWPFQKKWTLTFRPRYYKYFDSWDRDDTLPVREFLPE